MTARPQESRRGIIATRFIGRNCCHKMVTKVYFYVRHERRVYHPIVDAHKELIIHDNYCGSLVLLLFNCFKGSSYVPWFYYHLKMT